MRKVRDYDAELRALSDKARGLKEKRIRQLGELIVLTGADALDLETLAGVLVAAARNKDASAKEAWRVKGGAFFHERGRKARSSPEGNRAGDQTNPGNGAAG